MIKVIGDRVLVEPMEARKKSEGGIYIPDGAEEKPAEGKCVSVGDSKDIYIGDHVLYGKYSGTPIERDGVKYLIMRDTDIMAIDENPPEFE